MRIEFLLLSSESTPHSRPILALFSLPPKQDDLMIDLMKIEASASQTQNETDQTTQQMPAWNNELLQCWIEKCTII